MKAAAADAKDVDTSALSDSWDGVKTALAAIPGSGTSPSAAVESVTSALEPLQQAADDLKPQCEGSTTTGATTS